MKIIPILAGITLAGALAGQAAAQGPGAMTPEQREARFAAADRNGDKKLDKVEWISVLPDQAKAMADQIWESRVDADGDGFITREQFLALRMGPPPGGN
jgi:hypothetical protein